MPPRIVTDALPRPVPLKLPSSLPLARTKSAIHREHITAKLQELSGSHASAYPTMARSVVDLASPANDLKPGFVSYVF